jgi:hypothetical protein
MTNGLLGELEVLEMGESQINGATAVKYNYLTKNADNSLGELEVLEMGESQINGATAVKYNYLTKNADESDLSTASATR